MNRLKKMVMMMCCMFAYASLWAINDSIELPDSNGNDFYKSVGKLRGKNSCTTSFIKVSENPLSPAYLLTNGHCAPSVLSGNEIIVGLDVDETNAYFNYFKDTQDNTIDVKISSIEYSTMKGKDIAILKTDKTVLELMELGLEPYDLSIREVNEIEPIIVAGVPLYQDVLQLSYGNLGKTYDVSEYSWHWFDMVENDAEGIYPGSSGSPVFDSSKEIVGVINTTTNTAVGETCYSGNPCIITASGTKVDPAKNYMIKTKGLGDCFSELGYFDLNKEGCILPKPTDLELSNYPFYYSGVNMYDDAKKWSFTVSSPEKIRYKEVWLEKGENCTDPLGYSNAVDVSSVDFANMDIPITEEGVHQMCVIKESEYNAVKIEEPNVVQIEVDNTPPNEPRPILSDEGNGTVRIMTGYNPPEHSGFDYYTGDLNTTDCNNVDYTILFPGHPMYYEDYPSKLCLKPKDAAYNEGQVFEYIVGDKFSNNKRGKK